MKADNKTINVIEDNRANFIFKKGNYANTYISLSTTGLPDGGEIILRKKDKTQLYSPFNPNGVYEKTPCKIIIGKNYVIPLPAEYDQYNNWTDFQAGTYNWELHYAGSDTDPKFESKTIDLTVEIRDFEVWHQRQTAIYSYNDLEVDIRTYVDTIPETNPWPTTHSTYNATTGIAKYPREDLGDEDGYYELILPEPANSGYGPRILKYTIISPLKIYTNIPVETTYQTNSYQRYVGGQIDSQVQDQIKINLSKQKNITSAKAPVGQEKEDNSNLHYAKYTNLQGLLPGSYSFKVELYLTDGYKHTVYHDFKIATTNCSITLTNNLTNLTAEYLFNTTPLSGATIRIVNKTTNEIVYEGLSNNLGKSNVTITKNGNYQAYVLDGDEIILSSNVLKIAIPSLTDLSINSKGVLTATFDTTANKIIDITLNTDANSNDYLCLECTKDNTETIGIIDIDFDSSTGELYYIKN